MSLEGVIGLNDGIFHVSFITPRRIVTVHFTVVCSLSSISVLNELVECGTFYKIA